MFSIVFLLIDVGAVLECGLWRLQPWNRLNPVNH